jgi:hypothetical protein
MVTNKIQDQLPKFFGRHEVAKILPGVIAPKTLANLANSGMGPKFLKSGNRCIYLTADVLEWLEKRGKFISTDEQQWPETNRPAA